ncbi:MAG: PaaI family thioesterase [Myxococcota bacterium]
MPSAFEPRDPDWEGKVRRSFERQGVMGLFGARLAAVRPGNVQIEVPFAQKLSQQHGFFHAGITSTIADSACGYSAFSLFPPATMVLTTEFKINQLAPADGERLLAVGSVIKPGRTLTVVEAEVFVDKGERRTLCAKMLASVICREGQDG